MSVKAFLDTNIFVYAHSNSDLRKLEDALNRNANLNLLITRLAAINEK
ncbi:MAG: hypothetical protein FWE40_07545 [Oscillospiraceae bacterium]|nr:hypothetical protein [Oscillospiraceae bacterium]